MKQLQRCTAFLTILLLLTLTGTPVLAQDGDDMMDRVSFSVKAMQGAQYFRTDFPGEPPTDQAEPGFQRVRYNLEVSADLHERITLFVDAELLL